MLSSLRYSFPFFLTPRQLLSLRSAAPRPRHPFGLLVVGLLAVGSLVAPRAARADCATPRVITSIVSGGNFNAPATWSGGVVPTICDYVVINTNVTLNQNFTFGQAGSGGLTIHAGNTLSGAGFTITVNGGGNYTLTNNGTLTVGDLDLTTGTPGARFVNNGTTTINTSVVWDGNGRVINAGSLTISGGITFQGTALDNLAGATLNVSGPISLQNTPNAVLTNAGTITSTSNNTTTGFSILNGQFYNQPTGTLTMNSGGLHLASLAANVIRNEGAITVLNVQTFENSTFDNYNQVSVSGNWLNTGVLNTYAGSRTTVTGNYTQNNKTVAESVTRIGGLLAVTGNFTNDGLIQGNGGITVGGVSTNTSNGTIQTTTMAGSATPANQQPRLDFCDTNAGANLFNTNSNGAQSNVRATNANGTNQSGVTGCRYAICAAASPASINGPATPCLSPIANVVYSVTAVAGATNYTWTVPTGWIIVSGQTTASITVTPAAASGAITVTVTAGCVPATSRGYANRFVAPVPAAPATPGTISGPTASSTYCLGLTTQYAISPVANAASYTWAVPAGWTITSGQGTTSITATVGAAGGNITVTATNTCNTSAASSLAVAAPVVQPGTISGDATPCISSTGNVYGIVAVPGATSYTWTVPAVVGTITAGQGTINITVTAAAVAGSGSISVTASNGFCTSAPQTLTVSPTAPPAQPSTIAGAATPCPGTTQTYSVTNIAGLTYAWSVSGTGWSIPVASTTNSVDILVGTAAGTITVRATNSGGCVSPQQQRIITPAAAPATPGTISGNATPCVSTTGNGYSVPLVGGLTYTWTVPASVGTVTAGAGTNSITVTAAAAAGSGSISVTASNGTCTSAAQTLTVSPTAPPAQPGVIGGPTTIQNGTTGNGYSIAAVSGATSYTWTVPAAVGTITAGQGTVNITVTAAAAAGSGSISVTASNGICTSPPQTLTVTVQAQPRVDVVLSAGAPVRLSATVFDVPFTVQVAASNAAATSLQINHRLVTAAGGSSAFQGASSVTISSAPTVTGGLAAASLNGGFTGIGTGAGTRLLTGITTLANGASATITYTVRVTYPSVASVPTVAQTTQAFVSILASGTNNGYTFPGGVPTAPAAALDAEASTNSATLPSPAKSDAASLTPVLLTNPLAANDAFNTPNNTTLAASAGTSVLTNDAAVAPNTLNAATVDLFPDTPALDQTNVAALIGGGTFSVNASGQISYTPASAAFTGVALIQYTVRDNTGSISTIADISVNVGPSVVSDASSIAYNAASTTANVTLNDTDVNGKNTTTVQLINPVGGARVNSVVIAGVGTFSVTNTSDLVTFVPSGTFVGTASVGYNFFDNLTGNAALSATGTYTVTLTNANPVAVNDLTNTRNNTAVVFSLTANDTDANGNATITGAIDLDPTTAGIIDATVTVTGGTFTTAGQPAGSVRFTPSSAAFTNIAVVSYNVRDAVGGVSNTATASVNVGPQTANDASTTPSPTAVSLNVTLNDLDANGLNLATLRLINPITSNQVLSVTIVGVGTFTANSPANGSITFTPQAGFVGATSVQYVLSDNQGTNSALSSTATYTVTVTGAVPPVAQNITNAPSMTSQVTQTAILPLLATDADGVVVSYTIMTVPTAAQGALFVNGTYLNPAGFTALTITPLQATQLSFDPLGTSYGNFTFTYHATDNSGLVSNTATYTIPVTNVGPTANNDQNDVPLFIPTTGNVILNDNDPELRVLTVQTTPVTAPLYGTVVLAANGSYTYTPTTSTPTPDQFVYRVCDDGNLCVNATVFIRIYNPATACVSGTGANLLANPSFTAGNTGFVTNLIYVAAGGNLYPEDTYAVTANVAPFHVAFTGTGRTGAGDNFMAINASPEIKIMYAQTVPVQPNRYYTFSAYFKNLITSRNIAVPQVGFVINGQSTSGIVTIPEEQTGGTANIWTRFSDVWYSGSNTTATFEVRNLTIQRNGNDLGIDDIYFGTCNLPPVANADMQNTPPATPITFSLTANDNDGDGVIVSSTIILTGSAPGTPRSFTDASGNTFVVAADGNLTFTPAAGFFGIASITYTVQDNNGATSNPGVIAVTVQAPLTDVQTSITAPTTGSTVPAGQPVTVTVVTSNNGPSPAYNVVQRIELRPGLTTAGLLVNGLPGMLSGSTITFPGGATYNVTNGTLTFPMLATQAVGVGGDATNFVTFPAPGSGPLALTASVTHAALDVVPANNTATVNLLISPRFDLLTTINGPASVVTGNQTTFSVITANSAASSSAGDNVVQTVQLPANLVQVFVTNNGTYNVTSGVVTFPALNNLAPGQQVVNTISFDAPATGFTASATVTPNTVLAGDVNPLNNAASAPATVAAAPVGLARANPFVTIVTSATYVAPGTPVNLTIVGGNVGPDPAEGVAVSVQLPAGLTFTALDGGTYNATTGMLTFVALSRLAAPLVAGDSRTYVVTVLAPAIGPVLAAAVVTSTTRDVVASNNYMSTRFDVFPRADMAIVLTAPATANAGDPIVYTVTTTNLGGMPGRNLDQTLQIAPNLTGVTVSGGGTYNSVNGLVTFPILPTLAVGASQSYAVTITAPADITALRAVATVASDTPETIRTNNSATATTVLAPAADVTITITGPASGIINSPVSFVVTTLNNGPSVAASTTPVVQLPRNLILINLPAGATYVAATGLLTLPTLINLPAGGSSATAFTVVMPDVARLVPTATARVTAATNDRNLTNNFAMTTTIANAPTDQIADLAATVAVTSGGVPVTSAIPGQPLTFTATFTNNGLSSADGVAPRLALPSGLAVASVTVSNGGTYNSTTGLVTWPVSGTPLDVTTSYIYTVTLPAPANGPLAATAVVASATSDNVPANNSASTSVTITPLADVTSRVAGPPNAQPGEAVTYSITTLNSGPSGAANVQTTVTLPPGATAVVLPAGATQAGSVVTLPLDAFQTPGTNGQQTYLITFTPAAVSPFWSVSTTVSTATTETNTANNPSAIATTRLNQAPVAFTVVNTLTEPVGSTATTPRLISPLMAADADGTINSFRVVSLPPASQGILYVNDGMIRRVLNAANFPGFVLTPAQAAQLEFDPVTTFTGNAFFLYSAVDNVLGVSQPALYTLPIGRDLDSFYTNAPVGGGPNPYQNGDAIANLFDANGGRYDAANNIPDTGTRSVVLDPSSAPLPAGVGLNPATGRLFVTDRTLLQPGTYTLLMRSVDVFSGTNLVPVTFLIGNNPLPVELTKFEARGRGADALITWATASEKNSAYFAVDRSLDGGRTFTEVGRHDGAGTTVVPQQYELTDAGVGRTARTVYYRLRQVDTDGKTTPSDVVAVTFTGKAVANVLSVYPNPATTTTTVDLTDVAPGTYSVTLYDATGRCVAIATQAGGTKQAIDVQALPAGTYLLHVTAPDGFNAHQRLVRE